jgi:membrane associated rhomboid family serine protease
MRSSRVDFGVPSREIFPPVTKWLLIINIGVWVLISILKFFEVPVPFADELGLTPTKVLHGHIWQLFTYMFLHATPGINHILFNMMGVWLGAIVERSWGSRTHLRYYLICGTGAGVCVVIVYSMLSSWYPALMYTNVIGASGAIYGILLACALLLGDQPILFNFVMPMKLKWAILIFVLIDFITAGSAVSITAHLGGALTGFIYFNSGLLSPSSKRRTRAMNWFSDLEQRYKVWKMARAKRKFEVYMNKQDRNRGPWVH